LLGESVPELLGSDRSVGGLNNRDVNNLPSKRAVGQICEDLLQILFPGFLTDGEIIHPTSNKSSKSTESVDIL
jgi:serine O-acetyltransferase